MGSKSFTKEHLRTFLNQLRGIGIPGTLQEVPVVLEEVSGVLESSCGACKNSWSTLVQGFLYKVPGVLKDVPRAHREIPVVFEKVSVVLLEEILLVKILQKRLNRYFRMFLELLKSYRNRVLKTFYMI